MKPELPLYEVFARSFPTGKAPPSAPGSDRGGVLPTLTAAQRQGLPDFIIIGAMKAGTSALHHLLGQHPDIYIPPGEVFFFDVDDAEQHPDFVFDGGRQARRHDLGRDLDLYLEWYRRQFDRARPGQRIGEDSTTYIASARVPARVAQLLPETKLIALLRNPVDRAYSQYWHAVGRGRATRTFEGALRERPRAYLPKGLYHEQLLRWRACFPPGQLEMIVFEEFIADQQATVDAVLAFLGVKDPLDLRTVSRYKNASHAPLHLSTRLLWNRLVRPVIRGRYRGRIPNTPGYSPASPLNKARRHPLWDHVSAFVESLRPERRPPPMRPDTRAALERFYQPHNERLAELLGKDVVALWTKPKGRAPR